MKIILNSQNGYKNINFSNRIAITLTEDTLLTDTHHSPSENFAAQRSPFFGVYDPGNGGLLSSSDLICSINVSNSGPQTTYDDTLQITAMLQHKPSIYETVNDKICTMQVHILTLLVRHQEKHLACKN